MSELLEFVDPDRGSKCFAVVRRTGQSVGLAFNVIGETDFEVVLPVSVATQLAELINAAAASPANPA